MKPCSSCPFSPTAPLGLWHPAHYLEIAYLGSVDTYVEQADLHTAMACHKANDVLQPERKGPLPLCGGWLHAAPDSFRARGACARHQIDLETDSRVSVLSPREMMARNGFDLPRLPPLRWMIGEDARYPEFTGWASAVVSLRRALRRNPDLAWGFVLPGTPLARGARGEDLLIAFGPEGARRYRQSQGTS